MQNLFKDKSNTIKTIPTMFTNHYHEGKNYSNVKIGRDHPYIYGYIITLTHTNIDTYIHIFKCVLREHARRIDIFSVYKFVYDANVFILVWIKLIIKRTKKSEFLRDDGHICRGWGFEASYSIWHFLMKTVLATIHLRIIIHRFMYVPPDIPKQ